MEAAKIGQRHIIWNNRLKAVALGLGIALSALTVRHWYQTFSFGHPLCENCRSDFTSLYSGAKLMWENRAALYVLEQQLTIQKTIDPRIGDAALAYAYPPTTALVLAPLGWLSFPAAYLLMTLINGLALLLALRRLIADLELRGEQVKWLALTTFCNFGVHSALLQGQTSLIVVMLVTLFIRSMTRRHQSTAGVWSAALFFKPQFLPIPLVILAARRYWGALALNILLGAALAMLSLFLVGMKGIDDYFLLVQRFGAAESDLGTNPAAMHNLRALVHYGLSAPFATPVWMVLAGLVVIGVFVINTKGRDNDTGTVARWSGNLLAMILLSPHLHGHDLALLIPLNAFIFKLFPEFVPVPVSGPLLVIGVLPLLPWVIERPLPPLLPCLFLLVLVGCIWFVRRPVARPG